MKVTYHGHACISIELQDGTRLLFDPFITGNPLSDLAPETVAADYILVTHGHSDHIGDMLAIAQKNDAPIITMVELAGYAAKKGAKSHGMNLGGRRTFPFGVVKFVPALHSTGFEEDGQLLYMGEPAGIVLQADGKTLYHAGDTALFSDMQLIGEQFDLDLAFLPIGDNYTMGPEDAATAANWLQPKIAVPIHFDTFPLIKQDPQHFTRALTPAISGRILAVGETIEL